MKHDSSYTLAKYFFIVYCDKTISGEIVVHRYSIGEDSVGRRRSKRESKARGVQEQHQLN